MPALIHIDWLATSHQKPATGFVKSAAFEPVACYPGAERLATVQSTQLPCHLSGQGNSHKPAHRYPAWCAPQKSALPLLLLLLLLQLLHRPAHLPVVYWLFFMAPYGAGQKQRLSGGRAVAPRCLLSQAPYAQSQCVLQPARRPGHFPDAGHAPQQSPQLPTDAHAWPQTLPVAAVLPKPRRK